MNTLFQRLTLVALGICLITYIGCLSKTKAVDTEQPNQPIVTESKVIKIYSGQCTYYKKELIKKDTVSYNPVSTGLAKLVVNETERKFYFYYNDKLVFVYFNYLSDTNSKGGRGFIFDSDADAYISIAEKRIELNTEMEMSGQLGYQYEITNYVLH